MVNPLQIVLKPLKPALIALLVAGFLPTMATADPGPNQIEVAGRMVDSLQEAFNLVPVGGVIKIGPGEFKMAGILKKNNVKIVGSEGTVIRDKAHNGKAALVINASGVVIENIECTNIAVKDENGSCVRLEGQGLTLRNVYFHDSESGLLTIPNPGNVIIEDSRFERIGKKGYAHSVYQNGGRLLIRRCLFLSSKDQAHSIKSRADLTVIEDSIVASLEGGDSRLIDVPNGGKVVIRRNLLIEGPNSVNREMLSWGVEGVKKDLNYFQLEKNLIISDHPKGAVLIGRHKDLPFIQARLNNFVGHFNKKLPSGPNFVHETRSDHGLPDAPDLPDWPNAFKGSQSK